MFENLKTIMHVIIVGYVFTRGRKKIERIIKNFEDERENQISKLNSSKKKKITIF